MSKTQIYIACLIIKCTVLGSDRGDLNLTGAKIDIFRSAIWFRSAILIPNPNPIPNASRSGPNNFPYKITSNALVTLVAAKENCFHEPFLSSSGSEFQIDCRAGIVERRTAVRAESTTRHSETVQVGRSYRRRQRGVASVAGMRWSVPVRVADLLRGN